MLLPGKQKRFRNVPEEDLPMDPATMGEKGRARGEQGMESMSLALSSADEGSDRRDSSGGTRLAEKVRTRGEPQTSSQPLRTVLADFWEKARKKLRGKRTKRTQISERRMLHWSPNMATVNNRKSS